MHLDNTIPGLERALWALERLGEHPAGLSASDLGALSDVPRATLYRILRVLKSHQYIAASSEDASRFVLGPALARLANRARRPRDLVETLRPLMDQLSDDIGETVKLVVRDGQEAVTLAVSHSRNDSRIASRVGTRLPLYLGASQRLLLAHAPDEVIDAALQAPLPKRASKTMTSPADIRAELGRLRRSGCASSHSEGVEGVGAFAAAVRNADGEVAGVLVAVYVHAGKSAMQRKHIAEATLEAAAKASELLADG